MEEVVRTPVSVTAYEGNLIVACDDGTVWINDGKRGWVQDGSPIPGTRAAGQAVSR